MSPAILSPGYVHQGFSCMRSALFQGTHWLQRKNGTAGYLCNASVSLLSKGTEYLELPLRTVEDIALTLINLAGAICNAGCRRNLRACGHALSLDSTEGIITLAILRFRWIGVAVLGYHIAGAVLNLNPQPKNEADRQMLAFFKIKAIRTHGHAAIARIEKMIPAQAATNAPAQILELYKKIAAMSPQQLQEMLLRLKAQAEKEKTFQETHKGPALAEWHCPEELQKDNSPMASTVKHILRMSHGVKIEQMTKSGLRAYLCNLLNLPIDAPDATIKGARKTMLLLLHPDKTKNDPYASDAFKALQSAYGAFATS